MELQQLQTLIFNLILSQIMFIKYICAMQNNIKDKYISIHHF